MTHKTQAQKLKEQREQLEHDEQQKQLALYKYEKQIGVPIGDSAMIATAAERVFSLYPNAEKIGMEAITTVVQLALAIGANPLPLAGEIYCDRVGKQLFIAIGIDYYRRVANSKGGVQWMIEPRLLEGDELADHKITDGAIGAIASGYTIAGLDRLLERGAPFTLAEKRTTRTQTAEVKHEEMFYEEDVYDWEQVGGRWKKSGKIKHKKGDMKPPPRGRTWAWVAQKRAEKAVFKALGITDTSFMERMKAFQEFTALQDRNFETTITDEEFAQFNNALFDAPLPDGIDDEMIIDGTAVDHDGDEPPEPEPETIEIHAEPTETETVDETTVDAEPEPENADLQPNQFTPDENEVYTKPPRMIWTVLCTPDGHFKNTNHAKTTAKNIGFSKVPADPFDRVVMYRILKRYGELRDEGHDEDETLSIIDAESNEPVAA